MRLKPNSGLYKQERIYNLGYRAGVDKLVLLHPLAPAPDMSVRRARDSAPCCLVRAVLNF